MRKGGEALENSSFPILGMFSSFVLREVWNEKEKKHGAFPELRITISFISRSQCANRDESLPSSPSSSADAALSTSFSFYFFCSLFFRTTAVFSSHTHTQAHTRRADTLSFMFRIYSTDPSPSVTSGSAANIENPSILGLALCFFLLSLSFPLSLYLSSPLSFLAYI